MFWMLWGASHTRNYARNDVRNVFDWPQKDNIFCEKIFSGTLRCFTASFEPGWIDKVPYLDQNQWFSTKFNGFLGFWSKYGTLSIQPGSYEAVKQRRVPENIFHKKYYFFVVNQKHCAHHFCPSCGCGRRPRASKTAKIMISMSTIIWHFLEKWLYSYVF